MYYYFMYKLFSNILPQIWDQYPIFIVFLVQKSWIFLLIKKIAPLKKIQKPES